jgi:hypothetical protein
MHSRKDGKKGGHRGPKRGFESDSEDSETQRGDRKGKTRKSGSKKGFDYDSDDSESLRSDRKGRMKREGPKRGSTRIPSTRRIPKPGVVIGKER